METTHNRYKRVLREIAAGSDNPVSLAEKALKPRIPAPNPVAEANRMAAAARKAAAKDRRAADRQVCASLYNDWLSADRPPISAFARMRGIGRSLMLRQLERGERGIPIDQRRLTWFSRDPKHGYPTRKEIRDREELEDATSSTA